MIKKRARRLSRQSRVRGKIQGTAKMPRLSVFRSNKHIYVQLIDDQMRKTIAASSSLKQTSKKSPKESNLNIAKTVGENLAKIAVKKKITKVVFDRGGYKYHGRVKSLAAGARKGGLVF